MSTITYKESNQLLHNLVVKANSFNFPPIYTFVAQNNTICSICGIDDASLKTFLGKNYIMHYVLRSVNSTELILLLNQPTKSCPSRKHLWCVLGTSNQTLCTILNDWKAEEKWCYASLKSEAKQSRLIDDQHSLTLMRPCCPQPSPVHFTRDFLLTALFSLILFAFSTAGTVIVGFNYFTTKWYRWKIGVCN